MQPSRKIASNLLFYRGEWVREPLVELSDEGCVLAVGRCSTPDREPFTEFYAGVLVVGLSCEAFAAVAHDHTTPLAELLPPLVDPTSERLVLLSGLDYQTMSLTERTVVRLF